MDGKYQVSSDGGAHPRWSADGTELYYRDGQSVVAVPVESGDAFAWGPKEVLFEDVYYGYNNPSAYFFDVAPDGRLVMMKAVEESGDDPEAEPVTEIIIVQNWLEELKRHAPVPEGN